MVFLSQTVNKSQSDEVDGPNTTVYGSCWAARSIPKYEMPEEEMPPSVAYQLIQDETVLDGTPALNLASFVTTFMEKEARDLMAESMSKNFIDFEEYPQTAELSYRCINIIARLFHAPMDDPEANAIGCSTVGSTEGIILATLAMKRRWKLDRESKGLPSDKPNFIMGANVQVAWHKAMRYLEIEGREVPCSKELLYMDPHEAVKLVDENTIGVAAILGSTYTGHYEDVKTLNDLLEKKYKKTGIDVGIHVDAASGGFVAPFVNPDLIWDFRLPRVRSINVSGHKYGLTFPGIGWALWRSSEYLPEELVFTVNYLGSNQASFTLNFSKSASNIVGQYYVLIRLGKAGFRSIMTNLVKVADHLSDKIEAMGPFKILSEKSGRGLPLVAFTLKENKIYDEFDIAAKLRERGWIVPAYTMAPNCQDLKLIRIVVRESFSQDRCDLLLHDIQRVVNYLEEWTEKESELFRKFYNKHHHRRRVIHTEAKNKFYKLKKDKDDDDKPTDSNSKHVARVC
ncbi:glutamate decarboxylase [Pilobolus umbonatus]|nr:glutamate decarboxylase [Pilobolus umbonatus]